MSDYFPDVPAPDTDPLRSACEWARAEEREHAAKRERVLLYWIARAYQSGYREGWEPGPSVEETMVALSDLLANCGVDPSTPEGRALLAETHPRHLPSEVSR